MEAMQFPRWGEIESVGFDRECVAMCYNVLQCVIVCGSVLQRVVLC